LQRVKPDQRIPSLDGLRAVASLMVLAFHFGPNIAQNSFTVLNRLPDFLWEGIDLFFVLSGFLIAGILLESRDSERYFKTFYIRRVFRILPLYYVVVLSYCAALVWLGPRTSGMGQLFWHPIAPLWYLIYFQNFVMVTLGNLGPAWLGGSWSLAVEEQFYLILPAPIRKLTPKTLFWLTACALPGAAVLRGVIQKWHFGPMSAYVLLPARMDALGAGVLIAWLARYRSGTIQSHPRLIRLIALLLIALRLISEWVPNPHAARFAFLGHTVNAVVISFALLALLVSQETWIGRALSHPWMRELGNMAYSTYLFHPIVLRLVFRLMRASDPQLGALRDLGPLGLSLILTLAVSWMSWKYFERRMIAMGHQWRY
jgi:peptidoglycan/LPS O-acetylase OafA/YrhL